MFYLNLVNKADPRDAAIVLPIILLYNNTINDYCI